MQNRTAATIDISSAEEPVLKLNNGHTMPQLAFGLYKVPPTEEGESIVLNAIAAGYRHFDTASYYENEKVLGQALKKSGIPRNEFFICSKVWNDAQRKGREAVRGSVEKSLAAFDFGDDGGCYIDLLLVHWPVPGYHVETYKELELMCKEGTIRSIGLSNYKEKLGGFVLVALYSAGKDWSVVELLILTSFFVIFYFVLHSTTHFCAVLGGSKGL